MKTKNIVFMGMLTALLFASKEALAFLPNIEIVTLLIILFTLIFGKMTLYIIYTFIALEVVLYGISLWTINYLYIWLVLYLITRLLSKQPSFFLWALVAGAYGLCFGALCSIPHFFMGGIASGFAYWVHGIPFDIVHGVSNFIITLALFNPLFTLLNRLKFSVSR